MRQDHTKNVFTWYHFAYLWPDNMTWLQSQKMWHSRAFFASYASKSICAYMQCVQNTRKVFLHATRQDGTGNSENITQHATRQDHKGRSHNTWALLPASYSRSEESLSDFVSLMIENTKLLHIRIYVCEQSLLGSGTGLSLVSLWMLLAHSLPLFSAHFQFCARLLEQF